MSNRKLRGKKSKILVIFNKYKNTLNNFIDSSNIKSPNRLKSINKGLYNILKFENKLKKFELKLIKDFLYKDLLDRSL